jgi:hypothetical protein
VSGRRRLRPGLFCGLALAGGLALFAAAVAVAVSELPEWRTGPFPPDRALVRELRRIAERSGLSLVRGTPKIDLRASHSLSREAYRTLGEGGAGWLEATGMATAVRLSQGVEGGGGLPPGVLRVDLSSDGSPKKIEWETAEPTFFRSSEPQPFERLRERFAELTLGPLERIGESRRGNLVGPSSWWSGEVLGASPPQRLAGRVTVPQVVSVSRLPGGAPERPDFESAMTRVLLSSLLGIPLLLGAAGLFLALLLRFRIDLVNGALVAALALAAADPAWMTELPGETWLAGLTILFGPPGYALWIFFAWAAGESLLRTDRPGFTAELDTLRRGRLGPRAGRALALGFAAGAAVAGLTLLVYSAAVALPGLSPARSSLLPPVVESSSSPLTLGILLAATLLFLFALASRLLPERWAPAVAAVAAGLVLRPVELLPFPAAALAGIGLAGLLVAVCHRLGPLGLLAAAASSFLLPSAAFALLHPDRLPGILAFGSLASAAILAAGWVGLSRAPSVETLPLEPPAFMRRLAEERRFQHEVELLARMQVGLLPRETPRVDGWEIAARSVLAAEAGGDLYDFLRDERGRLWIAAGDVAGHGYTCAITQAMTKAALATLVSPETSPAEVLGEADRILRRGRAQRFASLGLLALDPATGEALFANAGHPFPLIATEGRIDEIESPGLPLGKGPPRRYRSEELRLEPGAALVFCSDGLLGARDRAGFAYGSERLGRVVRELAHRPALEILDAILLDSDRHLAGGQPPDDRTVVVVKRAAGSPRGAGHRPSGRSLRSSP